MQFRFIGDPNESPKTRKTSVNVYGLNFADGEAVEVTDPKIVRKLQAHAEFEAVGEDEGYPDPRAGDPAPKRGRPAKAKEAQE